MVVDLMPISGHKVTHAPAVALQRIANEPLLKNKDTILVVPMNVLLISVGIYPPYLIKSVVKRLLTYVCLVAPEWDVLITFSITLIRYQLSVPVAVILFRVSLID